MLHLIKSAGVYATPYTTSKGSVGNVLISATYALQNNKVREVTKTYFMSYFM